MFIAFRFFAGAGSWGFLALTPVYTAELAPAEMRGFFVGMNGVMIALGYAIASYMGKLRVLVIGNGGKCFQNEVEC
jgi:MFS family permease